MNELRRQRYGKERGKEEDKGGDGREGRKRKKQEGKVKVENSMY